MIRKSSYSIASAAGLGALMGTLVSIQFVSRFGFADFFAGMFGMLIGGFVGYITIDFRDFCAGVSRAWHSTIQWRPYLPYWKLVGVSLVVGMVIAAYVVIGLSRLMILDHGKGMSLSGDLTTWFLFTCFTGGLYNHTVGHYYIKKNRFGRLRFFVETQRETIKFAAWITPVGIAVALITLASLILKAVIFIVTNVVGWMPTILRFFLKCVVLLASFAIEAFINVHSDRRLVCFMDAATGAGIGFFGFHHAIAGLIAGAALGLVDYEIVSIRWLKVAS